VEAFLFPLIKAVNMKIKIIIPIISDIFNKEIVVEAGQYTAPDTEIEVINLDRGTASIESEYDEMLCSPDIVEKVVQAEKDGFDGVFVDCFGDPGVNAAREMVNIPVVGGFQPSALTACMISSRWSVVTVLKSVLPMLHGLSRKLGIEQNIASIRDIDTPVLELTDKGIIEEKLIVQIEKAVKEDGAEAVVLGCTGMMGLSQNLTKKMKERGIPVPVVDPTAAAIGFLQLMARNKISQSKLTYMAPTEKDRKF
jgi:allantoin racemase